MLQILANFTNNYGLRYVFYTINGRKAIWILHYPEDYNHQQKGSILFFSCKEFSYHMSMKLSCYLLKTLKSIKLLEHILLYEYMRKDYKQFSTTNEFCFLKINHFKRL